MANVRTRTGLLRSGNLLDGFVNDLQASVGVGELDHSDLVRKPEISLLDFTREAWPILEPGRKFVGGWHVEAICEHLEAFARFEIQRLLISMPPRHMKSVGASQTFTPWVWTWAPIRRFFYASYDMKLATRDSRKSRDIIESRWYQERWGDRVRIASDQNEKSRFENTFKGQRFSTSAGGTTTGEGGDYVICDDPHNVRDVLRTDSDVKRRNVLDWWDNAIPSRLNDQRQGGLAVIAQRVHQKDLIGHLLEKGGYVHLCLPAEYDGRRGYTVLGFEDPRSEDGELLWEERFSKDDLDEIRGGMSEEHYLAQYQQKPVPPGGQIFKWVWFRRFRPEDLPRFEKKVIFWDTAQSVKTTSAFSCAQLWGVAHNGYYLLDELRKRLTYPELKEAVESTYVDWQADEVVIENKSSGISVIQDLEADTMVPVIAYDLPGGNKEERAKVQAPFVKGGNVWVPEEAEWLDDFEQEVTTFPGSSYADQVDVMSMALEYLRRGAALSEGMDMS